MEIALFDMKQSRSPCDKERLVSLRPPSARLSAVTRLKDGQLIVNDSNMA